MTGVVASKSVTEASKGALRTIGNRPQSVMAKGRLTGRQTSRAGRKLEHSDPVFPYGRDMLHVTALPSSGSKISVELRFEMFFE